MSRRLSLLLVCAGLFVAGCGTTSSAQVNGSLGAKTLPSIRLPAYIPGPLDGRPTPRANALRRPLGVVIENYYPESRPQAGLASASTVVETLSESGITRFLAIYLENDANRVGPVRSTRDYFDRWAAGFHMILAHVGGNDDAQRMLWHLPRVFNIDEARWEDAHYNPHTPLFWRSNDRMIPHNMYSNTYKLRAYAQGKGQNWAFAQAYLAHKHEALLAKRGRMTSVRVTFVDPLSLQSNPMFSIDYRYQRRTNTYLRIMGGVPHVDVNTGHALRPSNVIVMHTGPATSDPYAGTPQSILIPMTGRGRAEFFVDGKVIRGSWVQPNNDSMLRFYDQHGRAMALNPGQTWIEVIPAQSQVSWS